jgi:hypothetical protein
MTATHDALLALFRDYGSAALGADAGRIAAFYADSFIAAGPRGSAVFANDDKFLSWLGQLHELNVKTRMTSMEVVSIDRQRPLSERHELANVEWGARFEKTGAQRITFRISYLVEKVGEGWKILAYVAEKDQEEELRRLGLL